MSLFAQTPLRRLSAGGTAFFAHRSSTVISPDPNDHDVELLRRIAAGDREAFAEFYDRHAALMYSVASKILGDSSEAQDVLQEVCLQVWEKASRFDPNLGKAASWAAILARNRSVDRLRALQRRTHLADAVGLEQSVTGKPWDSVNDLLYGHDRAGRIQSALLDLPEEQRLAIQLAYFSGLTQEEISQKLNTPLGTVKARIRRGLLKLRDQLEDLQ